MSDYTASQRAADQAYVRRAIRQSDFSNNHQRLLQKLVNLWFHHQFRPIHPGRAALANDANLSLQTVTRALSTFRSLGVLVPHKFEHGGRGLATHYRMHVGTLLELCGFSIPDWCKSESKPSQTEQVKNLVRVRKKPSQNVSLLLTEVPCIDEASLQAVVIPPKLRLVLGGKS